jgi:ATP-dependent Lon protease
MPRTNRPPSASDADPDVEQSGKGKDKKPRSSAPIPAHLLQTWANAVQKDNEKSKKEEAREEDDSSEGEEDDTDWSTDSEEGEPVIAIQVGGENGVTYMIAVEPDLDDDDDDSDEWEDYDEGEQSVESDSEEDDCDPEELEEVAAVIAELINEAMAEELEEEDEEEVRGPRKRRGGVSTGRGRGRKRSAASEYEPGTESEEDEEETPKQRTPVQTRSMKKPPGKRSTRGGKTVGENKGKVSTSTKKAPKPTPAAKPRGAGKPQKSTKNKAKTQTDNNDSDDEGERSLEDMEKFLSVLKRKRGKSGNGHKSGEKERNGSKEKAGAVDVEEALIKQFDETVAKMRKAQKEKEEKERKKTEAPIRKKQGREFRKLLKGKQNESPLDYFNKQSVERQKELLAMLRKARKEDRIEAPMTVQILECEAPESAKQIALRQAMMLSKSADSEETQKVKNWIDAFIRIPFGNFIDLPIQLAQNTGEEIRDYMINARKQLDSVAYGLDDAKTKLIEVVGQWIANPQCTGTSIALKGPMGTGKTTLIKEGLSKIIGRPFEFIALGGSTDGCTLEGHSYTYVGSTWGEIVSILQRSKCMNPVIYFDELDKISQSPKGQEIAGILTHLTDTSQNSVFHDKYFAGVPLDLSRVVFVFSYNDESLVNPILLNRMHKIETKGYTKKDKAVIATKYMLPQLYKEFNITEEEVSFDDDAIEYLANVVSGEEKGVRDLKRGLTTCLAKINLLRLGVPEEQVLIGGKLDTKEGKGKGGDNEGTVKGTKTQFPLRVTQKLVSKLARASEGELPFNMYS